MSIDAPYNIATRSDDPLEPAVRVGLVDAKPLPKGLPFPARPELLFDESARVRVRTTGPRFPFPVPNGWFAIAEAGELKPGDTRAVTYFGMDLVIWVGDDGQVHLADAYCPHQGAHLAVGGQVEDVDGESCLRCPFHGWAFDGSGQCTEVPYGSGRVRQLICQAASTNFPVPTGPVSPHLTSIAEETRRRFGQQAELLRIAHFLRHLLRHIHGIDKCHRQAFRSHADGEVIVAQRWEEETFNQIAAHAGFTAEVHRCADDDAVTVADLLQHGGQGIVIGADSGALPILALADEATGAAAELEVNQMDQLRGCTRVGRAFQGAFQNLGRVALLARTAVDGVDFLHNRNAP